MACKWKARGICAWILFGSLLNVTIGCATNKSIEISPRPDVSPANPVADGSALKLDPSHVGPMYTEVLPVDLPTVVGVAVAQNTDIQSAREAVVASQGELESAVGAAFPAIVPTALFEHVQGTVRATEGNLVGVGFNTFNPYLAVQWAVNPGRVVYDIIAAKKRLLATQQQEEAVVLETLRRAVGGYYDLVLSQSRVSAAHQSVEEAEELVRINRLRTSAGMGVPADELRAVARLAQRQQDLIIALKEFYAASVALAVTLQIDSCVTLIPAITELPPTRLVREDIDIEALLGIAVTFRPDLKQVRALVEAVGARKGSTWWGNFGPTFQAAYQYGGITGHANNVGAADGIPGNLIVNPSSPTGSFSSNPLANGLIKEGILRGSRRGDQRDDKTFSFSDQQRTTASVGWRLSVSAFGELKTAGAVEEQARIDAVRKLDQIRAQVINAAQASNANRELIGLAQQQIEAAAEALRLSEANLRAGAMTTLEVLQAQDVVTQARLRYAEAVVRYNQSQVNLLAALGLLDVETVGAFAPEEKVPTDAEVANG